MASVWSCSIDYSGVSVTLNVGGNPNSQAYTYQIEFHVISQPLMDMLPQFDAPVDYGHYVCTIGLDNSGLAFMGLQMQQDTSEAGPLFWPSFFGVPGISGAPQASFTGGGTITFVKDYDANKLTVTSPVGTLTLTLSDLDPFLTPAFPSYRNTFPLVPQGYGTQFTLADPTMAFPAYSVDYVTKFANILNKQDGVTVQTFPLSVGDGTNFWPDNGLAFQPGVGTVFGVLAPFWTITQEALDQKVEAKVLAATFPPYRIFTFWRSLTQALPGINECPLSDTGSVLAVWHPTSAGVMLRITRDDGHTWVDTPVVQGTTSNATVQYIGGVVYVLYFDGTTIRQTKSLDLGASWSTPVPVGISGTNPFLVAGPNGELFYFYCASGNLQLQRSFDGGATLFDATPIIVAAVVTPQTFGAAIAPDRTLVVSYIALGQYFARASRDYGATWSDA